MSFKPNQPVNVISEGESLDDTCFVIPNAFDQIGSDIRIKRSIALARHNIDTRLTNHEQTLGPGFRRDDSLFEINLAIIQHFVLSLIFRVAGFEYRPRPGREERAF